MKDRKLRRLLEKETAEQGVIVVNDNLNGGYKLASTPKEIAIRRKQEYSRIESLAIKYFKLFGIDRFKEMWNRINDVVNEIIKEG